MKGYFILSRTGASPLNSVLCYTLHTPLLGWGSFILQQRIQSTYSKPSWQSSHFHIVSSLRLNWECIKKKKKVWNQNQSGFSVYLACFKLKPSLIKKKLKKKKKRTCEAWIIQLLLKTSNHQLYSKFCRPNFWSILTTECTQRTKNI